MTFLSGEAKDEFRAIYREEFNEEITDEEAEEIGSRVLQLFHLPMHGDTKKTPDPRR